MRTLSAQEQQVVKAPGYAARMRVRVADGGGTLRDLTALDLAGGRDFTRAIRMEDRKDSDFATATVVLRRQLDKFWNISPLVTTSKLNLVSGSYNPLLATGRLCVVEAYMLPAEIQPSTGDWKEIFRGRVGPIMESQDTIEVRAFDLAHELSDRGRFLEVERKYGSTGGVAVQTVIQQIINHAHGAPFVASGGYTNRDRVIPTTANGFWYQAESTAAAGAEPVWPTTVGNTVVSGSVTFRCMGTIIQLYTPVSPVWNIAPEYNQKRVPCWSAIRLLADQLAWDLRMRWDSGTAAWRLTFSEPPRSKTTPDFTFYPDTTDASGNPVASFLEIPNAHTGVEDITNVWQGTYSDRADLDAAGQPKRKTIIRRDVTSIDANGWRWMGVTEDGSSQIDTQAEMERMLDGQLADTKDAKITNERVLPLFWAVELDDLIRWKADGYYSTTDLDLAVVGFSHEQGERGAPVTRLSCRGKPAGGFERWRARGFDVAARDSAPYNGPDAPTGVTVSKVQGGLAVSWTRPTAGQPPVEYEVHASTSSGFTPDSSTLKGVTDGTAKTIADLTPGTTYYVKVVPRDVLRNRGTASSQVSTDAGFTAPYHEQPQSKLPSLVANPSFEAQTLAGEMPDRWVISAGTFNTHIIVGSGSSAHSGSKYMRILATTNAVSYGIASDKFLVFAGHRYLLSLWVKRVAGAQGLTLWSVKVDWYSDLGTLLSTTTLAAQPGDPTTWTRYAFQYTAPSSARHARVRIEATGLSDEGNVDDVQFTDLGEDWTALSFGTNWTNWADSNYSDPGYMRNPLGRVYLRGLAKNTNTASTVVGTLPTGYRPTKNLIFATVANDAFFSIEIKSNGDVNCRSTPILNQWHSLAGISFLAEAA
jgi:hypothetical protein